MQKILGTGLTGLIGSRIVNILSEFEFFSISRSTGADVTDRSSLETIFADFDGQWILHLAAKADVDGCENDKKLEKKGDAWKINVEGTKNIAELSKKYNKKMIYISTDFVFDGEKKVGESYTEEDMPHPINWYGETKLQGENVVKNSSTDNLILRIANPYGNSQAVKKDFVRIIGGRLKEGKEIRGVADQIISPTFIDDIAYGIAACIKNNASGTYHLVGNSSLSPYDIAVLIAKKVGAPSALVTQTTRDEYFKDKALRPFNLSLNNGKIKTLNVSTKTFEEGLELTEIL